MGIGNTTLSEKLAVYSNKPLEQLVGKGTVNDKGFH